MRSQCRWVVAPSAVGTKKQWRTGSVLDEEFFSGSEGCLSVLVFVCCRGVQNLLVRRDAEMNIVEFLFRGMDQDQGWGHHQPEEARLKRVWNRYRGEIVNIWVGGCHECSESLLVWEKDAGGQRVGWRHKRARSPHNCLYIEPLAVSMGRWCDTPALYLDFKERKTINTAAAFTE